MPANIFVNVCKPAQTKNEIEVYKHTSQCACPLDYRIGVGTGGLTAE